MTRNLRRYLALTMSLMLVIFTICQSRAMAGMPSSSLPATASGPHASMGQDMAASDCHQTCQQLQAADLARKPQLPDVQPVLLASHVDMPAALPLPVLLVMARPDRAMGEPPPLLRFQRFLE